MQKGRRGKVLSLGNWENCESTCESGKLEGGINLETGVKKYMRFGTCLNLYFSPLRYIMHLEYRKY